MMSVSSLRRPWLCWSLALLAAKAAAVTAAGAAALQTGFDPSSYRLYGLTQGSMSEVDAPHVVQHHPGSTLLYPMAMDSPAGVAMEGAPEAQGLEAPTVSTSEQLAAVRHAVRERQRRKQAAIQAALLMLAVYAILKVVRLKRGPEGEKKGEKNSGSNPEKEKKAGSNPEKEKKAADVSKAKAATAEPATPEEQPAQEQQAPAPEKPKGPNISGTPTLFSSSNNSRSSSRGGSFSSASSRSISSSSSSCNNSSSSGSIGNEVQASLQVEARAPFKQKGQPSLKSPFGALGGHRKDTTILWF
ncbi:hypothetical protein Emag_005665 [Eimeria magna]